MKRTDSNTTGSVGTINFTASDDHSVASISAMGDGDNEGAHIVFRTTSAAANNSPYNAATPERVRITSDGKVGIGTNNPNQMFEITNTSGTGSQIQLRDTSTGNVSSSGFRIGYNGSGGQLWNFENTYVRFATNNNERLRITSGGQLNFGGNLTQTGFTASITRNSSETDILRIKGNGGNAFIRFEDNDASSSYTLGADDAVGSGGFALYDRSDSAYRVVVDTNGNFGINTTSPGSLLSVSGGTSDGSFIRMNNEEVGINFGAWGTGSAYPREATINGTRFDGGSSPWLRVAGQGGIKFCADLNTERMRIRPTGQIEIHSNGSYGNTARALNIGSRTSASYQGSLAIARGEALGGGTGPLMEFVHGPDGGTQRVHQISSYIGDLRIFADAAENLELSGVETKIKDSSRSDVAIFNSNGLEMEKNTARLFGRYIGRTNNSSNYELTHWTAGSFRILEVFGFINPNAAGSGSYHDPAHFYVYNATGWNGSSISYYLGVKHVAPGARTYAPSGTGNDPTQTIVAKWVNNNSTATTNSSHYLKFEWTGANTSNNYGAFFRVIRRM